MPVPDKAAQEAEASARAKAGIVPGEGGDALAVVDDGATGADLGAQPAAPQRQQAEAEPVRTAPPVRSPKDDARNAITARFRTNRGQEAEDTDDISAFTRSGMPPEFAENNAAIADPPAADPDPAAAAADPEPAAPALPPKVKVKVRGQEQELTIEELTAHAQKSLAADNYLDEAKGKLNEVDALLRDTKTRVTRDPAQQHPAAPNNATAAADPAQPNADPQHPEDPYDKLIQSIQFGDPAEARELLKNTISETADAAAKTAVNGALETGRLQDEGARTAKVLADFEAKHAEIAADPRARAVIESDVLSQQVADIVALGLDPKQLRQDGLPPTPGDIADAHRWYRAKGFKMTSPQEMLETGVKNYLDWRGVKTNTPADPPAQDPSKRVVDVTIDRTARRAAIPQQPGRTAVPRQEQRQQPAQPRDRSSIVRAEIERRNAPRGKVAVN